MMETVTTRSGHKWLLVYGVFGPFVARRDSPAAHAARREGLRRVRFPTLGRAYHQLQLARRGQG